MTAERWKAVKEIVANALELAPGLRPNYLASACGLDSDLRREVDELLASHHDAPAFLDRALYRVETLTDVSMSTTTHLEKPLLGQLLGPYRIEKLLGYGGMGAVYLGTRADGQFSMQAAIKVVRRGMSSSSVLERFHRERQIMARLVHPNIAMLHDGGVTVDGVPYFVMEYVEGERIDTYASKGKLGIAARLELMRSICSAVQCAHRNLVVHGDIKAGNILVTGDGTPKLLDFGIAQVIDTESRVLEALNAGLALTPDYASPEQLRGAVVTTLSDVYSLGVLLCEMVGGERPFTFSSRTIGTILRTVETAAPRLPAGITGNKQLADLDWIVKKALAVDPAGRYQSAEELSDDIGRYLAGLPVSAAPRTWMYVGTKFVKRNKVPVALAILLAASSSAKLASDYRQAGEIRAEKDRAERRFADLRKLADALTFELEDEVAKLPGSTVARSKLVARALEYLDRLAGEAAGDPALQLDLARAYQKMGDVQGRPGGSNLGQTEAALQSYFKSLRLWESLAKQDPSVDNRLGVAAVYSRFAAVLKVKGDNEAGLGYDRKAHAIREELAKAAPDNVRLKRELAASYTSLSASLSQVGDWDGARALRPRALTLFRELVAAHPKDVPDRRGLALAETRMGSILRFDKKVAASLPHYAAAVRINEELVAEEPGNIVTRMGLASAYVGLGLAQGEAGDSQAALATLDKARAIQAETAAADPRDRRTQSLLGNTLYRIGQTQMRAGSMPEALAALAESLKIREAAAAADPLNSGARGEIALTELALGMTSERMGRKAQADAWFARARKEYLELKKRNQANAAFLAEMEEGLKGR